MIRYEMKWYKPQRSMLLMTRSLDVSIGQGGDGGIDSYVAHGSKFSRN